MGRKWKKRGGKPKTGGQGKAKQDEWPSAAHGGNTKDWISSIVDAGNVQMEAFYAAQGLHNAAWNSNGKLEAVQDVQAWQTERLAWRKCMGQILPASFRIHRDLPDALQKELAKEFQDLLEQARASKDDDNEDNPLETHDGSGQPQARALTFLSDGALGYQLNVDRSSLRKHPRLKPLHEWLKTVTDAGHITRQETVSMIPPAVLEPRPSDTVLDMCAAPGSKTLQLLEHLTDEKGCIVANDANPERAALLTHQLKRVLSRNPACLVTACSAQFFPASVTKFSANGGFDKVLADVPCSGDGTSRKNIDIWRKWTVRSGLFLHPLQLQIASRGVQLLRQSAPEETYLCYSTCSQSPYENEAVVAALLRRYNELELVSVELKGFRTRPGLSSWKVFDAANKLSRRARAKQAQEEKEVKKEKPDAGTEESNAESKETAPSAEESKMDDETAAKTYSPTSMDDAALLQYAKDAGLIHYENYASVPAESKSRLRATVFPPADPSDLHLERCLRVLPHDNDTGGFFVALLRKKHDDSEAQSPSKKRARVRDAEAVSTIAEEKEIDDDEENNAEDTVPLDTEDLAGALDPDNLPVSSPAKGSTAIKGEEAYVPLPDELWNPLIEYYGLDASPQFRKDCFMCRIGSDTKVIHYVAPSVKAILDTGIQEKIHVISGGIKAFTRNSVNQGCAASHRVAQEAVAFVSPLMTRRKISATRDDFDRCLSRQNLPIAQFSVAFQEASRSMSVGSFVVELQDDRLPANTELIAVVLWRGRGDSLQLLVTTADMDAIKKLTTFLLGPSTIINAPAAAEKECRQDNVEVPKREDQS